MIAWMLAATMAAQPGRPSAAPAVLSDSVIEIEGRGLGHERFVLQFADGEWFVRPGNAHAMLELKTTSGTPVRLSLQWFGTQRIHVIDAATNSDSRGDRVGFFLDLTGPEPGNIHAVPYGDESVKLSVTTFTDQDIEAVFEGVVNELTVKGRIKLHRDAMPKRLTTGTFTDCDPVVYDVLYGADARSPSACEQKFDAYVRDTIKRALAPAIAAFEAQGWVVQTGPEPWPITSVGRGLDKDPFQVRYGVTLQLDPGGEAMEKRLAALEAMKEKVSAEIQALGRPGPSAPALQQLLHDMQGSTHIEIAVSMNAPSGGGLAAYSREQTVLSIPGAVYAVSAPRAQNRGGGGAGNAVERTVAWFGRLAPPAIQKDDDGGESIRLSPRFDRQASTLTAQTLSLALECNAELAGALLRLVDIKTLTSLLTS
jgi:hypothetical protein